MRRRFSSSASSRSRNSIWVRGVMTALMRRSPSRSAISTIAVSAGGMWPVATPSRSMKPISSSVTAGGSPCSGKIRRIRSVVALSNHSSGAPIRAIPRMKRASAAAMRSGWLSASRFGTNSPRISEKYDRPITTTAMLMACA